ncbi:DUF4177 domain-containing protein [Maritimibacter sp. 55A14]|uniref:DUF4177 domain-containing protein n=1 Tax=Maritimibacter sp. 55A14 TaxID=2174844 RepID=UPI000D61C95C|nr:DUF4177 domain-containing protein [Maritimibacter sp. 55A14]PWE34040.1 DUF4177 domain-containing protein [Maritimibacter sp. 55A14]
MQSYEYKVVPAPRRAEAVKGLRKTDARFAHTLAKLMNELGAEGWEYVRADALPVEERSGLTSRVTIYQNMLVFRRPKATATAAPAERNAPQVKATPRPAREGDAAAKEPRLRAVPSEPETKAGIASSDKAAE